ncbi:pyridoxal phosphate-dependent aminotransferase [Candidatus Bipolaricaulota bacterium]
MDKAALTDLSYADLKCPPPHDLVEALRQEIKKINLYPSEGYIELREAIAAYAGVTCAHVAVGNGGDELIDLVTRVWGDSVLIPIPTFGQFVEAAGRQESLVAFAQCLNEGRYEVRFSESDLSQATLVWICNPNNPTGTKIPRETILSILDSHHGTVVVDECYYEFLGETVVDLVDQYQNLVVLRSLSKSFGLAGLRLGYAISAPSNVKQLEEKRQIFSVNRLADRAGRLVFDYSEYYAEARSEVARIRDSFVGCLEDLGISVFESHTNFILTEFHDQRRFETTLEVLSAANIRVLDGSNDEFAGLGGRFLRFTIGTAEEMERVVQVLGNS